MISFNILNVGGKEMKLLLLQNHINLGLKLKLEWNLLALVYSLSDTIIIIKRRINAKNFPWLLLVIWPKGSVTCLRSSNVCL